MDEIVKKRGQKWSFELVQSRCRFRSTTLFSQFAWSYQFYIANAPLFMQF